MSPGWRSEAIYLRGRLRGAATTADEAAASDPDLPEVSVGGDCRAGVAGVTVGLLVGAAAGGRAVGAGAGVGILMGTC